MKENIPLRAVTITFDFDGIRGRFYVWRVGQLEYHWSALGNMGMEATHEEAITAARNWVRSSITKKNKEIE